VKKIIVEITGTSGKSFDLTLNDTAWFGVEGDWACLPGYMPATKGFFDYESSYKILYIQDRERTTTEVIGWVLSDPDTPSPNKLWGSLDGFSGSPAAGQSGKGHIFAHGKSADVVLKDHLGIVSAVVSWKIKSVS